MTRAPLRSHFSTIFRVLVGEEAGREGAEHKQVLVLYTRVDFHPCCLQATINRRDTGFATLQSTSQEGIFSPRRVKYLLVFRCIYYCFCGSKQIKREKVKMQFESV